MHDLRFAFRQLLKNPGFTAVAVLTLALGIGANTVVFSVAKTVLFRPLGFDAPDRLMWVRLVNTQTGSIEDRLSWREIEDIRESMQSFESVATFGSPGAIWEQGDRAEEVPALRVTTHLADVLRIRPVLGRMFVPSDSPATAEPVVLISHELWQSQFGGRPEVIGQAVRLDQKSRTIVGVLPPGLQFPLERAPSMGTGGSVKAGVQSFWFPFGDLQGDDLVSRYARMFLPVGRLKPGVSEDAARAELAALGQRLAADHPETNRRRTFALVSFRDQVLGRTRQGLPILAVAVGAVLLICCVNLANLLLARGVARQRELAVRLALGAGRRRLVQALMTESVILSLLGGALGIGFAEGVLQAVRVLASENIPFVREATVDGAVLLFTAGLSLLTALVFGLLPALRLTHVEATDSLRTGTRTTGSPQIRAWQRGLLAGQIAVVLVLLASAGLLLESFRRLVNQDLGYQPQPVVMIDLSTWGFKSNGELCRMYRALHARLSALPGVEAVGTISSAPLTGKWTFDIKAQILGQPLPEAERPSLAASFVAFDYFQAMGIPLLDGRYFRDTELKDNGYGELVMLNQAAAHLLFPGRSAVGGRFTVGSNPNRVLEVVGVVKDTREVRLEDKPQPRFYWQYAFGGAQVVVRSALPPRSLIPLLRDAVKQTDPRIIRQDFQTMTQIVSATVAERRFLMAMLAAYAVVALGIAAVGIFGVVACQVAQRTNEFGVRLALGASPGGLLRLVLVQSSRIVLAGLALGLTLSLATGRLLASQLFGLSPHDPVLLTTVSVVILLVALLASLLPARRAANVDPMEALRHE
jgi:predicted permease